MYLLSLFAIIITVIIEFSSYILVSQNTGREPEINKLISIRQEIRDFVAHVLLRS